MVDIVVFGSSTVVGTDSVGLDSIGKGKLGVTLAYIAYIHMPDFIGLQMILDMHTLICMLVFPL